ncbi:MAG TPA: hypothetical protein GXX14_02485 [Clostridiaceae bacterium]|nr:hypothetical protein [Clostridiaceae bacterium]
MFPSTESFATQKEGRKATRYCASDHTKKGTTKPKNISDAILAIAIPSTLLREKEKIKSAAAMLERLISRETAESISKSQRVSEKKYVNKNEKKKDMAAGNTSLEST